MSDFKAVEVSNLVSVSNRGALRALCSIRLGGLLIKDCRIVQDGTKRPWVSMPQISYKTQDGSMQYRTLVEVTDAQLRRAISEAVLSAWNRALKSD